MEDWSGRSRLISHLAHVDDDLSMLVYCLSPHATAGFAVVDTTLVMSMPRIIP